MKYEPDERESYKQAILSCVTDTMKVILHEQHRAIILDEVCNQIDSQTITTWLDSPKLAYLPYDVANVIAKMWETQAVKICYQDCRDQIYWQAPE